MYSSLPAFVLGFHGTDRSVAEKVISGKTDLLFSRNIFDWLGNGVYFWENDPRRALSFAIEQKKRKRNGAPVVKNEAVIGAVINPGHCLNMLQEENIKLLRQSHEQFAEWMNQVNIPLPENKNLKGSADFLLRELDCAVIQFLHSTIVKEKKRPFDTVRAAFLEGEEIYPGAGFKSKNHIQLCVCNSNCILGYFHPREINPQNRATA
ncbi:MAG: hypothetical protein AB2L13_10580 [Spirochaetota bacterium]